MKLNSMSLVIFISSQVLGAFAYAGDLACEQKHKQALVKLTAVAKTLSDADLKALLIRGKDSGIDIYELAMDEARMAKAKAAADAKSGEINKILGSVNCVTSVKQIEQLKKFFKTDALDKAVRVLNAMKGFDGLTIKVNEAIAKSQPAPSAPVVADNSDDGDSEVVNSDRPVAPPVAAPRTNEEYTMIYAADGLPIITKDHPIMPKRGKFYYSRKDFGNVPEGLSRAKLQQFFLGKSSLEGEEVVKPTRVRRCNFFVRKNCVK